MLALAIGEAAVRIYLAFPAPPDSAYIVDPAAGYRLRPEPASGDTAGNEYHVNALGFRDREHPAVKAPGTRRILGIGDSFVFGEVKLRDNFLRVAGRCLDSVAVPHEMILMGLGGYGPEQYVGVLRSAGLSTRPDRILLCFYVGNDVTGLLTRNLVLRGQLYPVSSSNRWMDVLRHSRLFVFVERRLFFRLRAERIRARRENPVAPAAGGAPSSAGISPSYLAVVKNRLPVYLRRPSPADERLWSEAERRLEEFDRICREQGIPWGLVILPEEIQVDAPLRAELLRRIGRSSASYDFEFPDRRLLTFAERRGVPALDLLPALRAAHRPDSVLYFPNDTHWNERGNRIAGEAVARFLSSWEAPVR